MFWSVVYGGKCAIARRWRPAARLAAVTAVVCALQAAPNVSAEEPRPYIIGPKDVLSVSVFNQPQLTGKYVVEADGMFTFPLVGRMTASGLTLRALEDQFRERLARGYLKDPQVTVTIDQVPEASRSSSWARCGSPAACSSPVR